MLSKFHETGNQVEAEILWKFLDVKMASSVLKASNNSMEYKKIQAPTIHIISRRN